MISIVLVGTGNLARHLFDAFLGHEDTTVVQVVGRNPKALAYFEKHTKITTDFTKIHKANIYIITVSDDAISTVSDLITIKKGIVVHTSGSMAMDSLGKIKRKGIFYPLQTFTIDKKIDFKNVPICIEAAYEDDLAYLKKLAGIVSDHVFEIHSDQRRSLHLAAVFANNFTNHMYHIGNTICEESGLPFSILEALIQETSKKIKTMSPYEAQTGPAKRGDKGTIEKHINLLKNHTHRDIYSLLSKSIQDTYGKKL